MPTVTGPSDVSKASLPVGRQGQVVLADLVALGQVGIEVVLAVPARELGRRGADGQAGGEDVLDGLPVDDRQRPRQAEADRAGPRVGRRLGDVGRAAAEHLRGGLQLDVDLDADDRLVAHGCVGGHAESVA